MSVYLNAIRDVLDYSKKTNQLLQSDLSFDEKLGYINQLLERRDKGLQIIENSKVEPTDSSQRLLKLLRSIDEENSNLMQALLTEKKSDIETVKAEKIAVAKSAKAQKTYMTPADEAGYYINNVK